jgi:hypothetical protein
VRGGKTRELAGSGVVAASVGFVGFGWGGFLGGCCSGGLGETLSVQTNPLTAVYN